MDLEIILGIIVALIYYVSHIVPIYQFKF